MLSHRAPNLAAGLGYRTVYWSVDPRDWDPATTTQDIINRVLNAPGLKPGGIILMHVNSPNERYALDSVIAGLEKRGYTIVPLSQLLRWADRANSVRIAGVGGQRGSTSKRAKALTMCSRMAYWWASEGST